MTSVLVSVGSRLGINRKTSGESSTGSDVCQGGDRLVVRSGWSCYTFLFRVSESGAG